MQSIETLNCGNSFIVAIVTLGTQSAHVPTWYILLSHVGRTHFGFYDAIISVLECLHELHYNILISYITNI